jgi:hypothetical protein
MLCRLARPAVFPLVLSFSFGGHGCFWDKMMCLWLQVNPILRDDLELLTLYTSQCWEYRLVSLWWVYVVLGIKARALCLLGKHSASWAIPQLSLMLSWLLYVHSHCRRFWSCTVSGLSKKQAHLCSSRVGECFSVFISALLLLWE